MINGNGLTLEFIPWILHYIVFLSFLGFGSRIHGFLTVLI